MWLLSGWGKAWRRVLSRLESPDWVGFDHLSLLRMYFMFCAFSRFERLTFRREYKMSSQFMFE